MSNITLDEGIL